MNRFIIEDANKDPKLYLNASILWLRDLGGGGAAHVVEPRV